MTAKSHVLSEMSNKLFGDFGTSQTAAGICRSLSNFSDALKTLEDLQQNPSPYDSEAARLKKRHNRATQLEKKVKDLEFGIYKNYQNRRNELLSEMDRKADLRPKATDAEVREVLRSMEMRDRVEFLNKAAENGDTQTLSAIANGNALLNGIDDETRDRLTGAHKRRMAPDEASELDTLNGLMDNVPAAVQVARDSIQENLNPAAVESAEQQATAAAEKESKFSALVG